MHLLYPFARRFIAGPDLPTALKSLSALESSGFLSTVDILGEHVHHPEHAETAKKAYLDLIEAISAGGHPYDFSVKVTQMGLDIDKELCRKNIADLLETAQGHTVRLDMEGSDYTQATLDMGIELHNHYKNLGCVIQAYLFRTESDLDRLIREGISVRLCKGAYKEPPSIAYQSMDDIRSNFLKLAFRLLKEGNLPAMATHDEFLLTEILDFMERENLDREKVYFEMLYGVRRDLHRILLDRGYKVRIYVPFGKAWLPYTLRRLTEKKENILFVMKHLFRETFGIRKLH